MIRKTIKKYLVLHLLLGLLLISKNSFASDLVEVIPLTNRILMVHFDDGYAIHHKRGEKRTNESVILDPLNVSKAMLLSSYALVSSDDQNYSASKNPVDIGRKSKGTEFAWMCENYNNGCINTNPDYAQEHWIYVFLPFEILKGKTYTLTLDNLSKNTGTSTFTYDESKLRSEALHVNNIGYSPAAPAKFAYLYHWMGDKGSLDLSAFNSKDFFLINKTTGQISFTGKIAFRKDKTVDETGQAGETPENNFSGADVYECDFSAYNVPGEYVLSVDGIGCSFPFIIDEDVYREPFFWTMKGLYQNRSGIELKAPFTDFSRPAPHNPQITPGFSGKLKYSTFRTFDLTNYDGAAADKPKIEAAEKGTLDTWGWYQDAGDWDGYYTHSHVSAMLLFLYETGRNKFTDNELNIPESGNGIPDVLDEASWLLRYFKRTKDEIKQKGWGTGGIAGARVFGDLWGGDTRSDETTKGSWEDIERNWYVLGEDPWTSYKYAAMAAQFAYILASEGKTDPEGVDWKQEAIDTYNWAKSNTKNGDEDTKLGVELKNIRLYANASLYRLTRNSNYHTEFIDEANRSLPGSIDPNNHDQMFASWIYLLMPANRSTDPVVLAKVIQSNTATANDILVNSAEKRACRWGGNFYFPMLIGQPTTPMIGPGIFGYLANKISNPTLSNQFLKYIYTTTDYFLGTNPLNTTWISGVGDRYPKGIFHLDWWYSGKSDVIKGVIPYGPWKVEDFGALGPWNPNWAYSDVAGNPRIYPPSVGNCPGHERWFDQRTSPLSSEFTIHQNTVLGAFAYGFLTKDKETKTIVEVPDSPVSVEDELKKQLLVYPNPGNGKVKIDFGDEQIRIKEFYIYLSDGTLVKQTNSFTTEGNLYFLQLPTLSSGSYLVKASGEKTKPFTFRLIIE